MLGCIVMVQACPRTGRPAIVWPRRSPWANPRPGGGQPNSTGRLTRPYRYGNVRPAIRGKAAGRQSSGGYAPNANRVPTLFWMNASGNRAAIACVARQPVQCEGTR
jgi:hypothetical protein